MSCGVGCRCGLDLALLWLQRRPAATALIRSLAREPPYAAGAAQEIAKRQKKKKQISLVLNVPTMNNYMPKTGQPGRNGQASRNTQPINTDSRRNRSFEQTDR